MKNIFDDLILEKYNQSNAELKYSNIIHRAQQEALSDGMLVVNENGKILSYNTRFVQMFNILKEVIETKSDDLVLQSVINTLLNPEEFINKVKHLYEVRDEICTDEILFKDGRIFERYTVPMYDNERNYYGRIWNFRDVTERKQNERLLRESEDRFVLAFKTSPYPIVITRLSDGFILEANDSFYLTTGLDKNETSSLGIWENKNDRDNLIQKLQLGTVINLEQTFKDISGNRIIGLYSGNIINIKNEKYILSSINNITNIKQTEIENKHLQEQLAHIEKMESIGTLAGGIAHDFNNLLMGIQGCTSIILIKKDKNDPDYDKLIQIEEQIQRGSDLTKQLLGFARSGKYDVKLTNINTIIRNSLSLYERTKKELIISQNLDENISYVEVDRGQIEQVLMNLFINAGQAMPAGGSLSVKTQEVSLNERRVHMETLQNDRRKRSNSVFKQYVKISVTDTGVGMDEKTKLKIFEPFFTTKEMGRGTGLGLASVYGIIQSHLGLIEVQSKIGEGTTFDIYLPTSDKKIVEEEKIISKIVEKGIGTILVVDDEKMVLEMVVTLLNHLNYTAFSAENGQIAFDILSEKKDKIDLIILDMVMPGMSGSETFDKLREINPNVKILLSSGYSINGAATKIMERGCNGFIQKPYKIEKLATKILEVLKG